MWKNGRQLATASVGHYTLSFEYNDEGIRTLKTVNGVDHIYHLSNSLIITEEWGNNLIIYLYDTDGSPIGMQYRNTSYAEGAYDTYWFEKNLQGDIVAVYSETGTKLIAYTYDAWGNFSTTYYDDIEDYQTATYNPFRYRGYYYDVELGFYYLNSRYYDPAIGRFINADFLLDQRSIIGNNLFTYCLNNPVNMSDINGDLPFFAITAAIGAAAGAIIGGVVAVKNGGNVWAGIGIGAAAGALIGTGAGMAAGATLAGSITATASQVAVGASTLATTVTTGGLGAGATYVMNNLQQSVSGGGGQIVANTAETGKKVYYQVTSSQAAQTIADTGKLIPSSVEGSVCVLNFQPTLAQAQQIGAKAYETVIRFTTSCSTFVPDTTVPYVGAFRNLINGPINVTDVIKVGFR